MSQFAETAKAPPEKKDAVPPTPSRRQTKAPMLQRRAADRAAPAAAAAAPSRSNLPGWIKAGTERLSGLAMDDVRVHRNSSEPAKIGALAYTKGSDIHLGPGQERHLPHEAWHVVQQKQGRVTATTQLKGLGINEDAGLEAEADRMGEAATRGATAPPARAVSSDPAGAAVVQAKVIAGETLLKPTDPVSPTLLAFIMRNQSYRLRDDFLDKLEETPVHLLDMSKKYLLGEAHGDAAGSKWRRATIYWSKVGRMFEWNKAMPLSERREVGMPAADSRDQPLESSHAYTLAETLWAHDHLNVLDAPWVKAHWNEPPRRNDVRPLLSKARETLREITYADEEYAAFRTAYEATARHSARSQKVYAFATDFKDVYLPAVAKLMDLITAAIQAVINPRTTQAIFEKTLDDIAANRAFLRDLATALIALATAGHPREARRLKKLLAPTDTTRAGEILDAVNPARERAMADNIAAAEAPLLVKLGDYHVDSLARKLGRSVVAIHKDEDLETATRQPPGP
jgi:hypothetical protein